MSVPRVVISGSGLAGALEAVYLAKQGFSVTLYEYRADMRTQQMSAGASQNHRRVHGVLLVSPPWYQVALSTWP